MAHRHIAHRGMGEGAYILTKAVYYFFAIIEAILAFRLVFRVLGANPASGFVSFIYSLSRPFVAPFTGIFGGVSAPGIESTAVLEPATIIAMVVYALIAWGISRFIHSFAHQDAEDEYAYEHTHHDHDIHRR